MLCETERYRGYKCKQLNNSLTVKYYAKWDFFKENVKTCKHLIYVGQDTFL